MAGKRKKVFLCSECGFDVPKWQGQCPNCGQWNTLNEMTVDDTPSISHTFGSSSLNPVPLDQISGEDSPRLLSGISELDRVLGGGMVPGSMILLSGEPGIGKSTLLLQSCKVFSKHTSVLYVSGEESLAQIKLRALRIGAAGHQIHVFSETRLEEILSAADKLSPQVMMIDSIQTLYMPSVASTPGSISQVRECAMALMQYAKSRAISVILVGHVNKDGGIAGPKVLEHMVDTVLSFEGDRHIAYRILRATKNRFGSTDEIGMFEMTSTGLREVTNPSAALLSGRPEGASGSCVAAVLEGTRPILAEVQGLVAKSAYGASRRMSAGIDYNRAVLLLAILEKRAGFMLGAFDAYLNVVGGLNLGEPAADLPTLIAIASSYLDKPVFASLAAFGEVGLSGEVRAVNGSAQRLSEIKRLGFQKCILPAACRDSSLSCDGIELIFVSDIKEAIKKAF